MLGGRLHSRRSRESGKFNRTIPSNHRSVSPHFWIIAFGEDDDNLFGAG